jgi:hypothetical protein
MTYFNIIIIMWQRLLKECVAVCQMKVHAYVGDLEDYLYHILQTENWLQVSHLF